MVAKIDARSVQVELQAVSTAMSEVTRLMGPQTWQGGSAAAFTTDLQGHNRALNRMILEVFRTVAHVNQVPATLPVLEIPRPAPPSGRPGVASVSPTALERLETALNRGADRLPGSGKMIRGLLAIAYPDIPSTAACDHAATWCRTQATRMRTRIMYALAENQADPLLLGAPMSQIPDLERFGRKEMTELGRLQAIALNNNFKNPTSFTPQFLTELGRTLQANTKDDGYLNAFFSGVTPGSIGKLAYRLHQQHGGNGLTPEDKKLLGQVGTALATLSRKKNGPPAVANALGPAGSDMPGQALLIRYANGRWASNILAELGQASLRWRQNHQSYRMSWRESGFREPRWFDSNTRWAEDWGIKLHDRQVPQEYDPALTILREISSEKNAEAARLLALGELPNSLATTDPRNYKFPSVQPPSWFTRLPGRTYTSVLLAPDWIDGGRQAGAVINLATRPDPGSKRGAAEIARQVVWAVSRWNGLARADVRKFFTKNEVDKPKEVGGDGPYFDLPVGLKKDLLSVATRYIGSFGSSGSSAGDPSAALLDDDPVTGAKGFRFGNWTAQQFLSTFAENDDSRRTLLLAEQAYERLLVTGAVRGRFEGLPLEDAMTRVGHLEGNVLHGLQAGYVNQGKTQQEALAAAQKDSEATRALTESLFTLLPGSGLTGNFLPGLMVNDPEELLSKADREKADSIEENVQTVAYDWGTTVKTELAIALYGDGKPRSTKITVDGTTYDVSTYFRPDGQLKKINSEEGEILRRWAEQQKADGHTGNHFQTQAETGYKNTESPSMPPPDSDPPSLTTVH